MKKLLFLLLLFFSAVLLKAQTSNSNRVASLQYYGQFIQPYFLLSHESNYNKELDSLKEDYFLKVILHFDTTGKIINLDINNFNNPIEIASYIRNLISKSNGKWLPEIKDGKLVSISTAYIDVYCLKKLIIVDRIKYEDNKAENFLLMPITEGSKYDEIAKMGNGKNFFIILRY
jgi:hypothetical protein